MSEHPSSDQQLTVQCPKCEERFGVSAVASIPDEQTFSMVLEHSSPFIAATTLGESITNMSKLLVAVAEDIGGKVAVMVSGCELSQGKTKIDFVITSIKS